MVFALSAYMYTQKRFPNLRDMSSLKMEILIQSMRVIHLEAIVADDLVISNSNTDKHIQS